jgi:hypothetical protein
MSLGPGGGQTDPLPQPVISANIAGNGIATTYAAVLAAGMGAVAVMSTAVAHDCQCRFSGQSYNQGEIICIRDKVARCDMFLNNSSWKVLPEVCPQTRLPETRRLTSSSRPILR